MANCPGLLKLVILLASIPRTIFWRKTKVSIVFRLLHKMTVLLGFVILTQNESGNKINLHLTTPEEKEYWEIRFSPITLSGVDTNIYFFITTNISGEGGSMANDTRYKNWIVNQNRYAINVYIASIYPVNYDMLSWSCLDKNGNAFSPNYDLPSNSYFTTKTTGLGSYILTKVSTPPVSNDTPILSSRFNPTKKYPLDLNFYWASQKST